MHNLDSVADATSQALAQFSAVAQRALGEALRQARIDRDLTQNQVARGARISRGSVANIERGEQSVSIAVFLRLAAAIDLDPAALIRDLPRPELEVPAAELPENLREQDLDDRQAAWVASVVGTSEKEPA
jgi:transcriptional regulator with XRE-family HTH domain